jgi:peroxiredoxin
MCIFFLRWTNFLIIILLFLNCFLNASEGVFPKNTFDIEGKKISFSTLSKTNTVCLITIKSPSCPVCIEQLIRIKNKKFEFQKCNLTFLVLVPGPIRVIKALAKKTKFPFPFIQDKDFLISEKFGLDNPPFQIIPAVILFEKDRTIKWKKSGRSFQYFSDQAIEDYLDCQNWL